MLRVGIIGYGYWGINLVRNFSQLDSCAVCGVSDPREERLKLLKKIYPNINTVTDSNIIINDPAIDAIVIATPAFFHFKLAKQALLAGKSVLVEKPMSSTVAEAEELIGIAETKNKILMVDHTFEYLF